MSGAHFLSYATEVEGFRWIDLTKLTWSGVLLTLPLYLLAATVLTRYTGVGVLATVWPFLPWDVPVESRVDLTRYTIYFFVGLFTTYPVGRAVDVALRSLVPDIADLSDSRVLQRFRARVHGDPLALRWKPLGIWVMAWVFLGIFPGVYLGVVELLGVVAGIVLLPWALVFPGYQLLLALAMGVLLWSSYVVVAALWWQYVTSDYYRTVVKSDTEEKRRTRRERRQGSDKRRDDR